MRSSRQANRSAEPHHNFKPPAYEPMFPGYRFDDYYTVGELYLKGKKDPCGAWAMEDIWSGSKEKVHCQLPRDHDEEEMNLPHMDFNKQKAWKDYWITDIWYKDTVSVRDTARWVSSGEHQT